MTKQNYKIFEYFQGSNLFYLADPTEITIKANGGERWGVKKEFYKKLEPCLEGHLDGTLNKGVVLPPIRKSDSKCRWGAIDVDGEVYNSDEIKIELLQKIEDLKLPLIPCYSKSKGLHLYIFFMEWTAAKTVRDILRTFLKQLELPDDTECFPKQTELKETDTGNGIMLPHMHGKGNDYIRSFNEKKIFTGTLEEFEKEIVNGSVFAESIDIDVPEETKQPKQKKDNLKDNLLDTDPEKPTKWEILKAIKDGTIKQHPTIGGKYYSWIQIIICKCVKQGFGDNEILKLIKEVHQDKISGVESEYTYPGGYQSQIDYTRKERQLNIPNPGDTEFLKTQSIDSAVKLDEIKKSYCYVMANDMFNKIGSGDFYQDKQINNFHKHEVFLEKGTLTNKLLSTQSFAKAQTFITSAAHPPGLLNIKKPGIVPLINKGIVLNIYIPNHIIPKQGDVRFIIEFFVWLLGEEKWKMIEQWIAFMILFPGIKMKWAVVLVSVVEGVGKGLLARLCSRILGSDNVNENANYKHLTNTHNTLLIGTQLLVLNEVSLGDFKSKQEGTNTLKNFVADDIYSCNFKNKPMVKLPNLTNFMLLSNDERVVGAPNGGRRYYFCNIKKTEQDIIQKTNENFYDKAWKFIDSDEGAAALLYYFTNEVKIVDGSIFKKRAPQTNDLLELIEQSKHPLQKKLEFDLTRPDETGRKIFQADWCGLATFDWLNDKLNSTPSSSYTDKFNWGSFGDDAIYKFLSANALPWNNGDATRQININGVRHRFYNLDDSCCPIPGKSYKDLTPKQIEAIYKHFTSIRADIRDQEDNLEKAKINLEDNKAKLKEVIKENIKEANKGKYDFHIKFKGLEIEDAYNKLISGELEVINKTPNDYLQEIKTNQKIIDIGIRTPEQILESYVDKLVSKRSNY